ncbi:Uncharacterised protein [Serratia marcescens]|uniref:DUF4435 domain-containing protein n=1 Tax=Serratia marcescens TaxID=615 RepID=UPI0018D6767B|nr:DUF4435 domain-containing protein [Serratia marcescens]MBH2525616.1 DUF4435 domain-containing protein [Serratia marcescens]CAI1612076.1 Uncharacterised protein [Serratia marcescens]HEJ7269076.1 DUF4435 domain-containing protein [Serratia marcescens]
MAGIPRYSADENLRRISRQKKLKFIVVEGINDVPIYEYVIRCVTNDDADFDVIHAGGKAAIQEFISNEKQYGNSIFILDKDFDSFELDNDHIVHLDRYSIENYYFCDEVISSAIAISLNCKLCDARKLMSIDEFSKINKLVIIELLKAILYYQKKIVPHRPPGEKVPSWSDTFICNEKDWEICPQKTKELIKSIIPETVSLEDLDVFFAKNHHSKEDIIKAFPGKMLKTSLQRYIRSKIKEIGTKRLNGKFSNIDTAYELLTAHLHKSPDLKRILTPVKQFVELN